MKKKLNTVDKQSLADFRESLKALFSKSASIHKLIKRVTDFSDEAILKSWQQAELHLEKDIALIALGSLGRCELLPHSDLDLLILHSHQPPKKLHEKIEFFIQQLWDQGFKIGHQVTTLDDYKQLVDREITIVTSLMDKRLLSGSTTLFDSLSYTIAPHQTWHSRVYFKAKWREQLERYKRFDQTAYNLEPNVKNGPGGLRDIQMIDWVAHRHFGKNYLTHCLAMEFITDHELQVLQTCQAFLFRVRFALHLIANKDENRILFDYQLQLTEFLGYKSQQPEHAVEAFMKRYFTVIKSVKEINQLTLELFRETIFTTKNLPIKKLNDQFQITNHYLDARSTNTFKHHPDALFSAFLYLNQSPNIKGIRGSTVRLIKKNNYLIDNDFRVNKKNTSLFITLLKTSPNIFDVLDRMNRYGLLSRYIPEFRHVIGQMQYDLFHIYTVDQHSLFVVRNLMEFLHQHDKKELRFTLIKDFKHIELLYIAALFHDIGKGRGGCHSSIGASDALKFCQRHALPKEQSELVAWLVQNHLLMSTTAQRKDIYETSTIKEFCHAVNTLDKLNGLYLLTSADILATNPSLWSGWKESLLTTLYQRTYAHLQNILPDDEALQIETKKQTALNKLNSSQSIKAKELLASINDIYFLHESPENISAHIHAILSSQSAPVVMLSHHAHEAGSKLFVYSNQDEKRLLITTTIISNHNLSIVEARIIPCSNYFVIDSYILLNKNNQVIQSKETLEKLKKQIKTALDTPLKTPKLTKSFSRQRKKIAYLKPHIQYIDDTDKNRTELILKASDKKGLLARLSKIFYELNIKLYSAKITTTGEEVEDSFYLTTNDNQILSDDVKRHLKEKIVLSLR